MQHSDAATHLFVSMQIIASAILIGGLIAVVQVTVHGTKYAAIVSIFFNVEIRRSIWNGKAHKTFC